MARSNFGFIKQDVLRQNVDETFDHILTLLPFSESKTYNETAKNSFRKTIIISTASIVEALLFYILDNEFTDKEVKEYYSVWCLENKKMLHKINDLHEVVAGDYKKLPGKVGKDKMNLGQITSFLKIQKILPGFLYNEIEILRNLRNDQHIGSHKKVKAYSKADLEKAFSVAKETKDFTRKRIVSKMY